MLDRQAITEGVFDEILSRRIYTDSEHKEYKTIERRIADALDDPYGDPVKMARRVVGQGGFYTPEGLFVDRCLSKRDRIIVMDCVVNGKVILDLGIRDLIEYVQRKNSPQLSLF